MRRIAVTVVLIRSLLAQAQNCPLPPDASPRSIAAQSNEARLAFLSKILVEESNRAVNWTLGWGATYATLAIAQLAIMPLFPQEEQPDWYWGALSTVVGVAFTVIDPLEVREAGPVYAQRVNGAPASESCALIAEGERLLVEGAAHELSGVQWYIHAANVLFNVGLGLVLGLGYGRWTSGAINAAIGTAIGEATILTSPQHLISHWKAYRSGEPATAVSFHVVPTAGPGVGVMIRF